MANANAIRYGKRADGTYSICRAKPENVGVYCDHGEHTMMTPKEAMAINEAVNRANAMKHYSGGLKKVSNEKADEYIKLVDDLAKYSDNIYDNAMSAIKSMESDYRFPVTSASEVLPMDKSVFEPRPENVSKSDWRDELSGRELSVMITGEKKNLAGRALLGDESKIIADSLHEYANRDIDRRVGAGLSVEPTPAEDRALTTLMANPLAGEDKTTEDLLSDNTVMSFGARYAVSSPYLNEEQKATAFHTAPENAIESQSLDGKLVNQALSDPKHVGDGSKFSQQRLIRNALRHPHVDPELAFNTMKNIQSSSEWNDAQKSDFDWQLAMNPNTEVAQKIAALDNTNDYNQKLSISKNQIIMDKLKNENE